MESSESTVSKLLGENVQKFRKKNNLTQVELSEKIGVSQKHLSDIETGTKFPSAILIEKLSKELNVSPASLFGRNEDAAALSNTVLNTIMLNLQPKLSLIFSELDDIKKMLRNMKITIQPDDDFDLGSDLNSLNLQL